MNVIMDYRAMGRTTSLVRAAARLQEKVPGAIVYLIAPTYMRAQHLSERAYESIQEYLDAGRGLVPDQTVTMHAGSFLGHEQRGKRAANKTFAFIDDVTDLKPLEWERLQEELTVNGVAISAIVVEAHR